MLGLLLGTMAAGAVGAVKSGALSDAGTVGACCDACAKSGGSCKDGSTGPKSSGGSEGGAASGSGDVSAPFYKVRHAPFAQPSRSPHHFPFPIPPISGGGIFIIQRTSSLMAGQYMSAGDTLFSPNGYYKLVMQYDGNLVIYEVASNRPLWATGTNGSGAVKAVMQTDGNFVLYTASNRPVWATNTAGLGSRARVTMQDNATLVLGTPLNSDAWHTEVNLGLGTLGACCSECAANARVSTQGTPFRTSCSNCGGSGVRYFPGCCTPSATVNAGVAAPPASIQVTNAATPPSSTATYAVVGGAALAVGALVAILYERRKTR